MRIVSGYYLPFHYCSLFPLTCRRLLLLIFYCQNYLRKNQNLSEEGLFIWRRSGTGGVGPGQQFEHEGQDQALARRCHVEVGRQRRLLRLLPRTFRGVLPGLQNPGR